MARPERHDADYFPFIAKDGKTLFILEGKYQCKGTGFFTNVMRFLTLRSDHHFCMADDADRMYFFTQTKCDEESGTDMLNIMATTGKIHKELWQQKRVIMSQDLLDSLKDAYKNRRNPIISIDQILVSYQLNPARAELLTIETPSTDGITYHNNPQTKGKETKVNIKGNREFLTKLFLEFKSIYPNPVKWKQAETEWMKKGNIPNDIINLLKKQIEAKRVLQDHGKFVPAWPDPERWIKHERWTDVIEVKGNGNENTPTPGDVFTICPRCKREILKADLDGDGCVKCAPIPDGGLQKILSGIGKPIDPPPFKPPPFQGGQP